jgi:hypothetical protein
VKAIILAAAAILLLCGCKPQGVTIHPLQGLQGAITFSITNRTADQYWVYARSSAIETSKKGAWQECFSDPPPPSELPHQLDLRPHSAQIFTVNATNLPAGERLRLRVPVNKTLMGLDGLIERVKRRWRERNYPAAVRRTPLNPNSKTDSVMGESFLIYSAEFTE